MSTNPNHTLTERLTEARQQREALDREASKREAGAPVLTPKAHLLRADEARNNEANKHYHLRWVNISDPVRAKIREEMGYERVPMDEGGAQLGTEYVLFRLPEEVAKQREANLLALSRARLAAPTKEMERMAENVAKILHDKYDIHVDSNKILVNE